MRLFLTRRHYRKRECVSFVCEIAQISGILRFAMIFSIWVMKVQGQGWGYLAESLLSSSSGYWSCFDSGSLLFHLPTSHVNALMWSWCLSMMAHCHFKSKTRMIKHIHLLVLVLCVFCTSRWGVGGEHVGDN